MHLPGLRAIRLRQLVTQAELAQRAGLERVTISRLETGTTGARISTVRRLAEALEVDPAELLRPANAALDKSGDAQAS